MSLDRLLDRQRHSWECRSMEYTVDPIEYLPDRIEMAYVCLDQFGRTVEVLAPASREVFDHPDTRTLRQQSIYQIRADKPRATRNGNQSSIRTHVWIIM